MSQIPFHRRNRRFRKGEHPGGKIESFGLGHRAFRQQPRQERTATAARSATLVCPQEIDESIPQGRYGA
jgi:hypothetical protein